MAIKLTQEKPIFRIASHENKIRQLSHFLFRFIYRTMTKPTVYQNNFAKRSGFNLQFLRQSAF